VQKRIILISASIVLALLAMFLVKVYLERQTQTIHEQAKQELAMRQERQGSVLVAARDIARGTVIDTGMLGTEIMLREYIQPQAVSSPERITGMMTLIAISKGEQITLNKLISSKEAMGSESSLAMATPMGKRAISISVDNIASLMGMIKPGDYVDVIATLPWPGQTAGGQPTQQPAVVPLFQNVLILTVGRELGTVSSSTSRYRKEEGGAGGDSSLITLALSPQEASLIAFVQEQGKIRLILRSPADSRVENITPASWETLFQYLMPQAFQEAKDKMSTEENQPLLTEKPREIEIYRGLKKETIAISK